MMINPGAERRGRQIRRAAVSLDRIDGDAIEACRRGRRFRADQSGIGGARPRPSVQLSPRRAKR